MIYYEVVEDGRDGSSVVRRFRTRDEAAKYVDQYEEWCYDGFDIVDTDSPDFFDTVEEE